MKTGPQGQQRPANMTRCAVRVARMAVGLEPKDGARRQRKTFQVEAPKRSR